MAIIGGIYYLSGIFVLIRLIYSIKDLSKISKLNEWSFLFSSMIGRRPAAKDFSEKKDLETLSAHKALSVFEWLWAACGLLSGNAKIFLIILAMAIVKKVIDDHIPFGPIYKISSFGFIFLRFFLYSLMIYGHFTSAPGLLRI